MGIFNIAITNKIKYNKADFCGGYYMNKIFIFLLFALSSMVANAETINLASKEYINRTCVTMSKDTYGTQTMSGNYTVSGSLSVPTPPLPPEE